MKSFNIQFRIFIGGLEIIKEFPPPQLKKLCRQSCKLNGLFDIYKSLIYVPLICQSFLFHLSSYQIFDFFVFVVFSFFDLIFLLSGIQNCGLLELLLNLNCSILMGVNFLPNNTLPKYKQKCSSIVNLHSVVCGTRYVQSRYITFNFYIIKCSLSPCHS